MTLRTYRATGLGILALQRILGFSINVTGQENLTDRPTLFVCNHFTRFETPLVPFVLWQTARRPVRTLAAHQLFGGRFGEYIGRCGVMSTRDPTRNRTIIRELATKTVDWVIYPEGGMVKSRRTVDRGRLMLDLPHRQGGPRTGTAVLALKTELCKRNYRLACEAGDTERMAHYESRYGFKGPDSICVDGTVITPITISYDPMRGDCTLLPRLARFFTEKLPDATLEELQVEGTLLFSGTTISFHFGEPIELSGHIGKNRSLARRVVASVTDSEPENVLLRRAASRLTADFMRRIYGNLEITFDHVFCAALQHCGDRIECETLHQALYLTADRLRSDPRVRLHDTLVRGLTSLVTGDEHPLLTRALELATREGYVRVHAGHYAIDQARLAAPIEFNRLRIDAMTRVLANEFEPVPRAVEALTKTLRLSTTDLRQQVAKTIMRRDAEHYHAAYDRHFQEGVSRPIELGEPFILEGTNDVGVVLVHGYLSCPGEMRPLAEHLNQLGYTVYGVRLEGHGTSPSQLDEITRLEWIESIRRGYAIVKHRCPRVVLGGFSLGGLVALSLAAMRNGSIDAVFTVNAPIRLRDRRAPFIPVVLGVNRAMRLARMTSDPATRCNAGTESPDINYTTDYVAGLAELQRVMNDCRTRLGDVAAPTLLLQGDRDPVVAPNSARLIYERLGSQDKTLLEFPSQRHVILRGSDCDHVFRRVEAFLARVVGPVSDPRRRR